MPRGPKPILPDDFVQQHGKTNYTLMTAAKEIGVKITETYARNRRHLLGLSRKWHTKKTAAITEFLRKYPYATGQGSAELYNNDPDFGKKYGKISTELLYHVRTMYRKELALPHGKSYCRSEVEDFIKSHADVSNPQRMRKLIKRELKLKRTNGYIRNLMKECGTQPETPSRRGHPFIVPDSFIASFVGLNVPASEIASRWNRGRRKRVDINYIEKRLKKLETLILTSDIPPRSQEQNTGNIVTVAKLTDAIMAPHKDMERQAAEDIARHIMNFFGYSDRIIDNVLEPEDRDAFYMLEDVGLLTTEREETTLYDGREWRIHYWLMRKDRIFAEADVYAENLKKKVDEAAAVYTQVPEEVWQREQNAANAETAAS